MLSHNNLDKFIEPYNASRLVLDKSKICQAPFRNMYFNVHGQAAACWLTFRNSEKYPSKSIMEIWEGSYFNEIRDAINKNQLSKYCNVCEKNILNGNFQNPLAKAYDLEEPIRNYPTIMEFEVSNKCNLECIMCNGNLSSSIRKNRDGLESLNSPYDSSFLKQMEEFIPHLKQARFNGGEPFLHKFCYDFWEKIIKINPDVEITIATNGSQYNSRIDDILSRGKFRINISVDGITKETYESVRINADFDKLMLNIKKFGDYCHKKGTILSIMINPMRNNWFELPEFINFCNRNNYHLWFNTIYRPFNLALWNLPSLELQKIFEKLSCYNFEKLESTSDSVYYGNVKKFHNFVFTQLFNWLQEQKEREEKKTDYSFWKTTINSSQSRFTNEFKEFLHSSGRDIDFEKLLDMVNLIETRISQNIEKDVFYHYLRKQNKDAVVDQLENGSLETFIEKIYFELEYY